MASDILYKIEHVLDERTRADGTPEFFVKWERYPDSESGWEPLEHMEDELDNWYIQELRKITSGEVAAPDWYTEYLERKEREANGEEDTEEEEEDEPEWKPKNATTVTRQRKRKVPQRPAAGSMSASRRRRASQPAQPPPSTNARQARRTRRGGVVVADQQESNDGGSQERRSRRDSAQVASSSSRTGSAPHVPITTASAAKKKTRTVSSAAGSSGQTSSEVQPNDVSTKGEDGSSPSRKRVRRSQAELMLEAAQNNDGDAASRSPVRKPRSKAVPGQGRRSLPDEEERDAPAADPPASTGMDESAGPSSMTGGDVASSTNGATVPGSSGLQEGAEEEIDIPLADPPAASYSANSDLTSTPTGGVIPSSKGPAVPGSSGPGTGEPAALLDSGLPDAADAQIEDPPSVLPSSNGVAHRPSSGENSSTSGAGVTHSAVPASSGDGTTGEPSLEIRLHDGENGDKMDAPCADLPAINETDVPRSSGQGTTGVPPLEIRLPDAAADEAMDAPPVASSGENADGNSSTGPAVPGFSGSESGEPPAPLENRRHEDTDAAMNGPLADPLESNDHSTSSGESVAVIIPLITAPTVPTTIGSNQDAGGIHDIGNDDSAHLDDLADDIPPKELPVAKSVTTQTTPSPTTTSSSQPSGKGDQGDDEGDGGESVPVPTEGGTDHADAEKDAAVPMESDEHQPIIHSTPSANGQKSLPSTPSALSSPTPSAASIPVEFPTTSTHGARVEPRRGNDQANTGRAAKVASRQDWDQLLSREGREPGDADSDFTWDTEIRTKQDPSDDATAPYILPKCHPSCYKRFDWEGYLAKEGGRTAPEKCFWKRTTKNSNNPFKGHEGRLLMAPPYGEASYVRKLVTCKIVRADLGPLVQVIPVHFSADPYWYFASDPVLDRLSKDKRAKAIARGYECVPKSCFLGRLTSPMLPAKNYFQIGHKLETYDRNGGENGFCWFWPATVVDVDRNRELITIRIDQMTADAPKMMDEHVRFDDLRLFPCGFASAVGWKCAFPTETESMYGRPSFKGTKMELIHMDDDGGPSTSQQVSRIKQEPAIKMEMDQPSQAKKTRMESNHVNTAAGAVTNMGQFRAPITPSTFSSPARIADLLLSGAAPSNSRVAAAADKQIKEEPAEADDTEPFTAPPASSTLHPPAPIADGPSSSGTIEPPRVDPTMASSGAEDAVGASRLQQDGNDVDMAPRGGQSLSGPSPSAPRAKPRRGFAFLSRGSRGGARGGLTRADQMGGVEAPSTPASLPQPMPSIPATALASEGTLPVAAVVPTAANILRSIGDASEVPFDWDAHLASDGGEAAPHAFLWKRPTTPFANPFEDRVGQVLLAPDYVKPGEPLNYELSTVCEVTNTMGPWVQVKPLFVPPDQKRWFMADDAVLKKFSDIDNLDKVRIPAMGAPNNFMNRVKKYAAKDDTRIAPDDCFGKISIADQPNIENFKQLVGFKVEAYSPFNGNGVFWPATVVAVHGENRLATVLFDGTNGTHEEKIPDICLFPCGYAASIGWTCELTRNLEKAQKKKVEDKRAQLLNKKDNVDSPSTSADAQVSRTSRLAQVLKKINKPKTGRKRGRPRKNPEEAILNSEESTPKVPRKRGRPSKADMIMREQELNGGQNQVSAVMEAQVFTPAMRIPVILRKPSLKISADGPSTSSNHADNAERQPPIPSQSGDQQLPGNESQQLNGHKQSAPIQRQNSSTSSHSSSRPTQYARVILKAPPHQSLPTAPNVTLLSNLHPHPPLQWMPIITQRSITQPPSIVSPPAREQTLQYVTMSKQLKRGHQSAYAATHAASSTRTLGEQSGHFRVPTMQGVPSATTGVVQATGAQSNSKSSTRVVGDGAPSTSEPHQEIDYARLLLQLQSSTASSTIPTTRPSTSIAHPLVDPTMMGTPGASAYGSQPGSPGSSMIVRRVVAANPAPIGFLLHQMPSSIPLSISSRPPSETVAQPTSSSVQLHQTPTALSRPLTSAAVAQLPSGSGPAVGEGLLGAHPRSTESLAPPPPAVRRPAAADETADDKALWNLVREVEEERPRELLDHLKKKQVTFRQLMGMTEDQVIEVSTSHPMGKQMYARLRQIRHQ